MMHTRRLSIVLLACCAVAALSGDSRAGSPTQGELETAISAAFAASDYAGAAALLEEYLSRLPNHARMHYHHACALSRLGEVEPAASALFRAVQAGFTDFTQLREDPDLEAIRGTEMYQAILQAADRVAGRRAEDALERWKRTYGDPAYRFEVDEARRLAFATALDSTAHAEMREMLQDEADHLITTLFDEPPDYFVLIAVPTPEDARLLFGGDEEIGGRYEHHEHRVVARNIGASLRHEFVHALHYGHMERLGLTKAHPIWIQEGLAALYENYTLDETGSIRILANERDAIVRQRLRVGNLIRWSALFTMPADRFMNQAGHTYPEARSVFVFLAERSLLAPWYRAYVSSFELDPTGADAFEAVFRMPLADIEAEWREWIRTRDLPDTRVDYGDASLGIVSSTNSGNDGVTIEQVLPDSAARQAGLRKDDVIVAVNGKPTRSLTELQAAIAAMNVGDLVEIRYRRNGTYEVRTLVLQPLRPLLR